MIYNFIKNSNQYCLMQAKEKIFVCSLETKRIERTHTQTHTHITRHTGTDTRSWLATATTIVVVILQLLEIIVESFYLKKH